eukprot:7432119-Pyramimonas_sp.AAC.1
MRRSACPPTLGNALDPAAELDLKDEDLPEVRQRGASAEDTPAARKSDHSPERHFGAGTQGGGSFFFGIELGVDARS